MSLFELHRTDQPTPEAERAAIVADPVFGKFYAVHMAVADYTEGLGWHDARIIPTGQWQLHPAAAVFHYGQEIFEGLKAYRHADSSVWLFRPEKNARRFISSAERLEMAPLPEDLFLAALATSTNELRGLADENNLQIILYLPGVEVAGLLVAVAVTGDGSVGNLASRGVTAGSGDYWAFGGGLMATMIVGLATLVGFDSAANMAEEARTPHRTVPRAIVGSVVAAGILGMLFLIALTVAIDDVDRVSRSGSPVADILRTQLGSPMERILLVCVGVAFFGGGLVTMTSCARMVFAMSRDGRFPGHRVLRRVNSTTRTPIGATVLPLAIGVITMIVLPGDALIELITAGTLFPALTYGFIVVLYLAVRQRLSHTEGAFSLGRLDIPVAVLALVWTIAAIVVLVAPGTATSTVIVVGLIALGAVYLASMLVFRRSALDAQPPATTDS